MTKAQAINYIKSSFTSKEAKYILEALKSNKREYVIEFLRRTHFNESVIEAL